jgi:hypothetical protein
VLADLSGFALFVEAAKIKMTSIALAKIFVTVWQKLPLLIDFSNQAIPRAF